MANFTACTHTCTHARMHVHMHALRMHACTHTYTHTHNCFMALWTWYQKKPSPTHTYRGHVIPCLLPPSITIHGILPVQFTCLTVFFNNLSPSFLWSTSWPGTLNFILHTFFHPIAVFFLQHMPIPSQPVLL